MPRLPMLAIVAFVVALGIVSVATSDQVGVAAKVVKALEKPGKSVIKVVWKDGSSAIHKGAAGDPTQLIGDFEICITQDSSGFGERMPAVHQAAGAGWLMNSDTVAKYKNPAGPLQTLVVKPNVLAKAVAKSDMQQFQFGSGLVSFGSWPPQGGYVTLNITNGNDASSHRFCSNLGLAASVVAKEVAYGAGRKLVWKDVPPDVGCVLYNNVLASAGCSPSGAFLD